MNKKEIELISLVAQRNIFTFKQIENLNNAMTISRYVIKSTAIYLKSGLDIIEAGEK